MSDDATAKLIIGRGGLIGGALARRLRQDSRPTGIEWHDPVRAEMQLARLVRNAVADRPDAVTVYWCAGAGYVGASAQMVERETAALARVLDELRPLATRVTLFLTSSAGAVHAGGPSPSSERSAPSPLTDYGVEKLRQEALVRRWCEQTGGRGLIGRLTNIYGPGQDIRKPQGLISQLVRASIVGRPLSIFVPMETGRDYLFVHDAATLIDVLVRRANDVLVPGESALKLIGSGRTTTIGSIVAELGRLRKKRPPVVFGSTPASAQQPRSLGIRSEVWTDVDALARTTLAEGIGAVLQDQLRALRVGAAA